MGCRETYFKSLTAIIKLASLQTSFNTLDEEIKMTGRRVNALEYVIIPRIEDIMKYIEQEMDEQAREEFFRVKKVVEKKKIKLAKELPKRVRLLIWCLVLTRRQCSPQKQTQTSCFD